MVLGKDAVKENSIEFLLINILESMKREFICLKHNEIHFISNDIPYIANINDFVVSEVKLHVVKTTGWTLQSYVNQNNNGICKVKVGDGQELTKKICNTETEAIIRAAHWAIITKEKINES